VLLLMTARPESLADTAAASAVRRLASGFELSTLDVAPLEPPAAAAMLQAAHPPLAREQALDLARESGGVPLEALRRLHALVRSHKSA
jgi:hypothetical protein